MTAKRSRRAKKDLHHTPAERLRQREAKEQETLRRKLMKGHRLTPMEILRHQLNTALRNAESWKQRYESTLEGKIETLVGIVEEASDTLATHNAGM